MFRRVLVTGIVISLCLTASSGAVASEDTDSSAPDTDTPTQEASAAAAPADSESASVENEGLELEPVEPTQPGVTTFRFKLKKAIPIQCRRKKLASFKVPLPGRAIAKLSARLRHRHPTRKRHFWSLAVEVGEPEYRASIGDNICPGDGPFGRLNFGIGRITATDYTVDVVGRIGSTACSNGSIWLEKGSYVEVMVFNDEHAKEIRYASWMKDNGKAYFFWKTRARTIVETEVIADYTRSYRILATVEGSPRNNPNKVCGRETHTLMSRILIDGRQVAKTVGEVPGSPRWGHLVRSFDKTVTLEPGRHPIELQVGKNFTSAVSTGGCCGDGIIIAYPE